MAGRGSGAQHPGASLGVGSTNSGGTSANKGLAAPANADGFHTPLSSLPNWANTGECLLRLDTNTKYVIFFFFLFDMPLNTGCVISAFNAKKNYLIFFISTPKLNLFLFELFFLSCL